MCMDNYFDSIFVIIKHKVVMSSMDGEKDYKLI